MRSLFKNMRQRLPFKGNLVRTHYLIGNPKIGIPMRKMECKSVLLKNMHNDCDALILSNTELTEANNRFVKYIKELGDEGGCCSSDPGTLRIVKIYPRNWTKKSVEYKLVYFKGWLDNAQSAMTGFIFNMSELDDIVERTKRISKTVVRPGFFKRWLIKWFELED